MIMIMGMVCNNKTIFSRFQTTTTRSTSKFSPTMEELIDSNNNHNNNNRIGMMKMMRESESGETKNYKCKRATR